MTSNLDDPDLFDNQRVKALFAVLGDVAGRRLLASFADALPFEARAIAAVAARGNLIETERCAHSLKGAAANFGAARLQAASCAVESAARTSLTARRLKPMLIRLDEIARRTSDAARNL